MELSSYRIFNAVATTGNFSKAARSLYLSPSAISHAITKMEKDVGFPLFIRSKNNVILTTYGREILPQIQNLLALHSKIHKELEILQNIQHGVVHIGTYNSTCCYWLPSVFQELKKNHLEIQLIVHEGEYPELESNMKNGTLDISFLPPIRTDILDYETLYLDKMVCIAPLEYTFKQGGLITIEEISNYNLVASPGGYTYDIQPFFSANHIPLFSPHTLANDSSIVALVESGLGISILPSLVLKLVHGNIQILDIQNNPYRTIGLATQKQQFVTPATQIVKDIIKKVVKSKP